MKNLMSIFTLSLLIFSACSNEQPADPVVEDIVLDQYSDDEISFEYPAGWNDNGALLEVNQSEVFGLRCSAPVAVSTYLDEQGRSWEYNVMKSPAFPFPGEEANAKEEDPCFEFIGQESTERTAEISLENANGEYLSRLFYTYNVENEESELKTFETILNSLQIK